VVSRVIAPCALGPTARDQVEYQDDYGNHDQDVNEIATEVTDKSQ